MMTPALTRAGIYAYILAVVASRYECGMGPVRPQGLISDNDPVSLETTNLLHL